MSRDLICRFDAPPEQSQETESLTKRAARLKTEIKTMEDAALQKRFAAIFDDGQGDNARDALVRYCRTNGYHPSEMALLAGNTLLSRLWRMLKIQQRMIDAAEVKRAYLVRTIEGADG